MVRGLNIWKAFFKDYTDYYVFFVPRLHNS
jgi:hypothetical protein